MADFPSLRIWTDAYLGDAYHLTTEEHGAYFLLLMAAWRSSCCRLPDDDRKLANITRCTQKRWCERIRPVMAQFWTIQDGFWTQKRLSEEYAKVRMICANRSRAGVAAAQAKALKRKKAAATHEQRNDVTYQNQNHKKDSESDSNVRVLAPKGESRTQNPPPDGGGHAPNGYANGNSRGPPFEECWRKFWACWDIPGSKREPKKARAALERALKVEHVPIDEICAGVRRYMDWARRTKTEVRYLKHPTTWLNGGCWADELAVGHTQNLASQFFT